MQAVDIIPKVMNAKRQTKFYYLALVVVFTACSPTILVKKFFCNKNYFDTYLPKRKLLANLFSRIASATFRASSSKSTKTLLKPLVLLPLTSTTVIL